MNTSESINEIAAAMAQAQSEIQNPTKDQTNPHFKNRYADLAGGLSTIRPTLAKYGLSVVQLTHADGDMITLHTRIMHSSGQWLEATYPVCRLGKHQEMGSALTYARRYALFAAVGVAGDDDDYDGNMASTARGGPSAAPAAPKNAPRSAESYAAPISSYALKKDKPNLWPDLELAVRTTTTVDALTTLWDETQEEAERWPQTWRDARWELFEKRTEELNGAKAAAE